MQRNIIIKNGLIVDPRNKREEIGNLYISQGRIVAINEFAEPDIVYDATGKYVMPGLVDFHTHVFRNATEIGIDADVSLLPQGVTTTADAGSAGVSNMESFIQDIVCRSAMQIKAFINVGPTGFVTMKYHGDLNPKYWDKLKLKYFLRKYPDIIKGMKLEISKQYVGDLGIKVLEQAVSLANELDTKLIIHTDDPPEAMDKVVQLLRPGDVFAHCYQPHGNTILGMDGKVLSSVREAQERGVIMDAANGGNHWAFSIAEAALKDGFKPDIISTDLTVKTLFKDPVFGLPFIMSKYLALGMSMFDIVKCCTDTPAKALEINNSGSLGIGSRADVAIFALKDKKTVFTDTLKQTRIGERILVPQVTICDGKIVYRSAEF